MRESDPERGIRIRDRTKSLQLGFQVGRKGASQIVAARISNWKAKRKKEGGREVRRKGLREREERVGREE